KSINALEKKIEALYNKIRLLREQSAKQELDSLSAQDRAMLQKLKNQEIRLQTQLQKEKIAFAEINNAHKQHMESMEARHRTAHTKLKASLEQQTATHKASLNTQVANERKAANDIDRIRNTKTKLNIGANNTKIAPSGDFSSIRDKKTYTTGTSSAIDFTAQEKEYKRLDDAMKRVDATSKNTYVSRGYDWWGYYVPIQYGRCYS
ncbi:MAG: hypothetical protein B7Z18_01890, partial [Alishewanella sp. 32-51-5]